MHEALGLVRILRLSVQVLFKNLKKMSADRKIISIINGSASYPASVYACVFSGHFQDLHKYVTIYWVKFKQKYIRF